MSLPHDEAREALMETAREFGSGNSLAGDVIAAALRYTAALLRTQGYMSVCGELEKIAQGAEERPAIKNLAPHKYDAIAHDSRIATIRPATPDECEGEPGWVMVVLAKGCTLVDGAFDGGTQFLATGVIDIRRLLARVRVPAESES